MNLFGLICALAGSWMILAALGCTIPHRLRRAAPPQPAPEPWEEPDSSWIDDVPSDCLSDTDPLLHERFHALVDGEVWFGGALRDPWHHLGGAA